MEEAVYSLKGIQDNQTKSEKGKNKCQTVIARKGLHVSITRCVAAFFGKSVRAGGCL